MNDNAMTGPLPAGCGSWVKLYLLDCFNNQFTGTLPPSIGNWTEISELALGWIELDAIKTNNFSGTLPDSIGSWKKITVRKLWRRNMINQYLCRPTDK